MSGPFGSPEMRCRLCGHRVPAARLGTRCPADDSVLVLADDADARATDEVLGRVIGEKFPVVGILGEGGFGAVYRAVQEPIGRQVALKVIRGGDAADPETRARFFREAKVVAALSHPAVVTLHDYGEEPDGLLYIAFELVAGRPLGELIRTDAPFDPARAVGLVCQVLAALSEAHELGLLHRDLKPDNLMVVQGSLGEEIVRLLDFGLSKSFVKADDSVATRQGIIMGTPRYMSPEQASGQPVDGRSDLYSLGILLYEMLSGQPPFLHPSPLDLLMAHIGAPVPPLPAALNLPPALENVLMRTLAKQPELRPQSADELARALEAAVAEPGPVQAAQFSRASMPAGSGGFGAAHPDGEAVAHLAMPARPPVTPGPPAPASPLADFGTSPAAPKPQRTATASAPTARGKGSVPVRLGGLLAGVGIGVLVWFVIRDDSPPAPATLEPARQVVIVGGDPSRGVTPTAPAPEPESEAPATAPPSPWERAIEFGRTGLHPEAGAQLIYLFRASQDPWAEVERARYDKRLEAAMKLPQVKTAIAALPPKGTPSTAP